MIETMRTTYAAPLARAFKEAPWRTQTQAVAVVSISLLIIAIIGGFYLTVASRAATAGRDLQRLEVRKAELIQANDELRAELSVLRSVDRLAQRAVAMGFTPAQPEQIHYLRVDNYPYAVETAPVPRASTPPAPPANTFSVLADWFAQVLQGLVLGTGPAGQGE
jgi:hypothetical protein